MTTVVWSGIEDAQLQEASIGPPPISGDLNYGLSDPDAGGGAPSYTLRASDYGPSRGHTSILYRAAQSTLPGIVLAWRLKLTIGVTLDATPRPTYCYRMIQGGWVEGSGRGDLQAACCANYAIYDTTPWQSPMWYSLIDEPDSPHIDFAGYSQHAVVSIDLPLHWLTWGPTSPGLLLRPDGLWGAGILVGIMATGWLEHPTIELDISDAAPAALHSALARRRGARGPRGGGQPA